MTPSPCKIGLQLEKMITSKDVSSVLSRAKWKMSIEYSRNVTKFLVSTLWHLIFKIPTKRPDQKLFYLYKEVQFTESLIQVSTIGIFPSLDWYLQILVLFSTHIQPLYFEQTNLESNPYHVLLITVVGMHVKLVASVCTEG